MERFKDIQKLEDERNEYKKTCSCGCISVIPPKTRNKKGYITCRYCGKKLFKDDEKQRIQDEKVEREAFRLKMWSALRQA